MKRNYWLILVVYLVMQLSSIIGVPVLMAVLKILGKNQNLAVPYWLIISFSAGLVIVLFLLRNEMKDLRENQKGTSLGISIIWAVFGVFLALFAQMVAANIENLLGIPMGSENTQDILNIIHAFPLAILVSSIFGPILEEIIFRKILFGSLYLRFNFFISALISSLIFALAHMDPQHILIYSSIGFTFAFLYVKTKRIAVPIFAHLAMNTFVVIAQTGYQNHSEQLSHHIHVIQNFIGGLL